MFLKTSVYLQRPECGYVLWQILGAQPDIPASPEATAPLRRILEVATLVQNVNNIPNYNDLCAPRKQERGPAI